MQKIIPFIKTFFTVDLQGNRVYGLDILRAVALVTVLISHCGAYFNHIVPNHLRKYFGFDGVVLSFVLSGFLIGGILIKTLEKNGTGFNTIKDFWGRRILRILPLYYLILIFICLVYPYFQNNYEGVNIIKYFFFVQNFNSIQPKLFTDAYSLSIEIWFYILLPLLVFLLCKITNIEIKNSVLISSIAIILFSTGARVYKYYTVNINTNLLFNQIIRDDVITRLDSVMLGVIGIYICLYQKDIWLKHKTPLLYLGLVIMLLSNYAPYLLNDIFNIPDFKLSFFYCIFGYLIFSLGTLCTLPYLNEIKTGQGRLARIIATISVVSFPLYLVNRGIVSNVLIPLIKRSFDIQDSLLANIFYSICFWVFTFIITIFVHNYIEVWIIKLREKLIPNNASSKK